MFFGSGSDDHKEWQERVLQDFSEKIDLGNELRVDIDINFGSVLLKSDSQNTNSIINEAKHSLADALKKTISNL